MNAFNTAVKFFQDCGLFIYPSLLIMSLGLAIAIERLVFLARARSENRRTWEQVLPMLQGGRFKVEVAYQTAQNGGLSGMGNAVPLANLGFQHGGAFWFFSKDNPEMLIKILNVCASGTPRYWVFYSAGTNVGLTITVTDTATGHVKVYTNPDLKTAVPVSDTEGLPCS